MSPAMDDATIQQAAGSTRRRAMCAMCRTPLYLSAGDRGGRRCCSIECRAEKREEDRRRVAERMRHDYQFRQYWRSQQRKHARSWGERSASPEEAAPRVLGVPGAGLRLR